MFARCHGPIWRADDFSLCFQQDYLQALLPLIAAALSFAYLLFQVQQTFQRSRRRSSVAYRSVSKHTQNGYSRARGDADADEEANDGDTSEDTESEQDPSLTLATTKSHAGASTFATDQPRGELWIAIAEQTAVLATLGIQVALLLSTTGEKSVLAASIEVAIWAYIALLTTARLTTSAFSKLSFPKLWKHTAFLYSFQWLCAVMLFRSHIIHPRTGIVQKLVIAYFAIVSFLAMVALTSRKGNRAVELEYEGDILPSQEPLASLFSLGSFSWVTPIVWHGYKTTYEMASVWNLIPKDKSANILADYRQLKKTSILAFHLVRYFRRDLIIQAFWAVIAGAVTFLPTLLLKAILQYVENPADTPRNAAWFYVFLLFVSGMLNALANGQALWLGRRICIRIRAIIIGEIYAKALRRRAATSSDKVLGGKATNSVSDNQTPKSKRGLFNKIFAKGDDKKKGDPDIKGTSVKAPANDGGQVSSGAIINLMAVDSFKVAEISAYLHFLWAETPVQFVLAIYLLYHFLGSSSVVGIIMMALLLPLNLWIAKTFSKIQKRILAATDARIDTTNEVLTNIRIIKFFAWEQRFLALVDEKRATELRHLRNRYILWAFAATVWTGAPIVITFFTFAVYTMIEKKELVPSVAFTALSLFNLLRMPLDQLADMVAHVQESKVSVDRVEEYLNEPETDKYNQLISDAVGEDGRPTVGFEKATFSWSTQDSDEFKMLDLDLHFKIDHLNVIIGPTGSGKSSMLMALLGEMALVEGSVYLPGGQTREDKAPNRETGVTESVAYCAQQAWLVNGTIKENIVFAGEWDARRYKDVIVACSLQRDLEILDNGDQTLVGEKGVTLSGGQKQRISLARALYSRARYVLLDDVLSAVDSHTAKWIFDKALMGPLMWHRTCILVTHNATLCLPHAAFAVVLDNGRVTAKGTAAEVITSGKLAEDLAKIDLSASRGPSALPSRVPSDVGKDALAEELNNLPVDDEAEAPPNMEALTTVMSKDIPGMSKVAESSYQTETKSEGSVKFSIIIMYLKYMGSWFYWILVAVSFAMQQVIQVATNVWVREWSNAYTRHEALSNSTMSPLTHVQGGASSSSNCLRSGSCLWNVPSFPETRKGSFNIFSRDKVNAGYYLGVYAAIGISYMIITLFREGILFGGSITASKRIHRKLMESVTHAKFRFFDSTPLGQIMNRFSKDVEAADQEVAPVAVGVVHCLFSIITIVVLISVITPGFLVAALVISLLYILIGMFYINSSRDLKRLESIQRSPLYQQFGETLTGMITIRAYGDERRFVRENLQRINAHSRPFIYLWAANRWLAFRVDVVGALVSFSTGAFVIASAGSVDAGAAGLAMTYAVTFTENVLWFVRLYAANEQNMNAIERVKEYLDVEQEAPAIIEENRPPANWPSKGSVEFVGYSTRYRSDFDFVLKNVTFRILSGEKVGVVGRTGAGKSSLALALFRALEAEEGKILVDDLDIGLVGLQDLRENIVMVPQDPTLFTGNIRSNLDPFGLFTDEDILTALRRVQLIGPASVESSRPPTPTPNILGSPKIRSASSDSSTIAGDQSGAAMTDSTMVENKNIFRNLSSPVAESGSNLSQGQRQLLCLARAMLKDPKVLLMDEATASIDYATDARIQETIREIKNTTITIAHRLQTIIDYDKVLVLDRGEVIEFGEPLELISKDGGVFRGMCETSGDLESLVREAKAAHDSRKLVDDD